MKRHESLKPLSREHHDGLLLAQLLKTDVPDYKGMPSEPDAKARYAANVFNNKIKPHFKKEEEILMPRVRGRSQDLDRLQDQLLDEHQKIGAGFEALENNPDPEAMDALGRLLEKHIRTEEREYFPGVQEEFSEEELQELGIPEEGQAE